MNTVDRHKEIIRRINKDGKIKVQELCDDFHISPVTARKDLKLLEEKGLLYRMHGGATLTDPYATDRHVNDKEKLFLSEKMKIGATAAKMVNANDSILIASGTSVLYLAKSIQPKDNLTVITSALNVAFELNKHMGTEVILLGGVLRKRSASVTGLYAEANLQDFSCSKLFLGVDGIDLDFGLTTTNVMEAHLNRKMIDVSQKTIVLADSTKFGKRGFGRICGFEDIDEIITDEGISDFTQKALEDFGIKVTIVS